MARRRKGLRLDGWLNIDKDPGMTSAHVVAAVRRITNAAKAGHAGTLDPLATGVLPIALGEATKSMTYVLHGNKSYRFTARWGESRDTDDEDGEVTATSEARPSDGQIEAALPGFIGDISQVPPVYSAIKVDGRRAYDLARKGEKVDLQPRMVSIYRFELVERPDEDHAIFEVDCGTGTYVRALIRDLAEELGALAHIKHLRRTRSGPFGESSAISVDKLRDLWQSAAPAEILLPIETALDDIPALALTEPQADRLRHGQAIRILGADDGTVCAMTSGRPVAIALVEGEEVRPLRVFNI